VNEQLATLRAAEERANSLITAQSSECVYAYACMHTCLQVHAELDRQLKRLSNPPSSAFVRVCVCVCAGEIAQLYSERDTGAAPTPQQQQVCVCLCF
jgi:hypothetical protein